MSLFLDFEQPIAELQAQIDELRHVSEHNSAVDLSEDIRRLEKKNEELTKKIFGDLGAWQVSQMARHPQRPYTLDYIEQIFTDFDELAGDRAYADDKAIVGGIARLDGEPVMIIGPSQLRRAAPGRVPQGSAPDGDGRALQDADHHLHRHPGCLPRRGCRGAWPVRSHRPQPESHGRPDRAGDALDLGG